MLLNASLVYSELKELHDVEIAGPGVRELHLSRPEFYMDDENVFRANRLYVATVERLPKRPVIEKGSVLVCIGQNAALNLYRSRMCVITVKSRIDFFRVYQEVQGVFDKYEAWERSLYQSLLDGSDLKALVHDAADIFKNPVIVLDKSFRLAASSGITPQIARRFRGDAGSLDLSAIADYLADANPMLDRREPVRIELLDTVVLSTNLFNEAGDYEGCFCVYADANPLREGDEALSAMYAGLLQRAIKNNAGILNSEAASFKTLMQTLLDEMPLAPSQHFLLDASNRKRTYVCVSLRTASSADRLPSSYICNAFENAFADSYSFPHGDSLACFVSVDALAGDGGDYVAALTSSLQEFVANTRLYAGVSNEFSNLFDIRAHFSQAESAIDNGLLVLPDQRVFYFESFALMEMVINAMGGQSARFYYPKGLKELIEHDEKSGVSYVETLSAFLEEGMSYAATAERLCIHRSTLVDRISRITRESGIDLKDPEQRLQIEMLLKATQIERFFQQ